MPRRSPLADLSTRHVWRWLAVLVLVTSVLSGGIAVAQPSGAGGTLLAANGEVVVTHSDGTSELAKAGDPVNAGDRVAVTGSGGALIGYSDGSTVGLQPRTTVDLKQADRASDGSVMVVADQSRGLVTAETPPGKEAQIRVTSQAAGSTALLKQGGMAVRLDESTNTVSVGCEGTSDRVFFPYEDMRVPCEQRIVRTLTDDGDIIDNPAGAGSLISAVFDGDGERRGNGVNPGGQVEQRNQREQDRDEEEDAESVNAPGFQQAGPSPSPSPIGPGNFSGTCSNRTQGGSSCSISATGLQGGLVGGIPQFESQSITSGGSVISESFPCSPISSSLTSSCTFVTTGKLFQGSPGRLTYPLAGGGQGSSVTLFFNCNRPTGTVCPDVIP